MRKRIYGVLVLMLLFSLTLSGCRSPQDLPPEEEASELASAFVAAVAEENFTEAYGYFNHQMTQAISLEQFEDIWEQLKSQLGPFVREAEQREESQPPYRIVIVTIQMGSTYLDTRIVFNRENQVAGLFFQPSDYLSRFYEPPEYADPEKFSEYEVVVGSGEWALPGTMTVPAGEGPFPFVVLVHGSGPHDRNETIGPNRPFQDLAWGLATQGVGVLRYEKRTKEHGMSMGGMIDSITPDEETVADAVEAVALLRETPEVHPARIYVLGHSLGGMLAPRIARESDIPVAGLVIMAGTPRSLEDLLLEQVTYLLSLKEETTDADREQIAQLEEQITRVKDSSLSLDTPATELPLGMPAAYWLYLRDYEIGVAARSLDIPFLILQGERDYQVTMKDFDAWQQELKMRPFITYRSYSRLNHLMIAGDGPPNPDEYAEAGNVDIEVINDIATWVKSHP